jgi:hypothetical protein
MDLVTAATKIFGSVPEEDLANCTVSGDNANFPLVRHHFTQVIQTSSNTDSFESEAKQMPRDQYRRHLDAIGDTREIHKEIIRLQQRHASTSDSISMQQSAHNAKSDTIQTNRGRLREMLTHNPDRSAADIASNFASAASLVGEEEVDRVALSELAAQLTSFNEELSTIAIELNSARTKLKAPVPGRVTPPTAAPLPTHNTIHLTSQI